MEMVILNNNFNGGNKGKNYNAVSAAQAHYNIMTAKFNVQTLESLRQTKWLRSDNLMRVDLPYNLECITISDMVNATDKINKGKYITKIKVVNQTTTEAAMQSKGKPIVLNFASYKNPGGGFMAGAVAQEECLCADSNLYNILEQLQPIYAMQGMAVQGGVYYTSVFYTPDVVFKSMRKVDVITCAAPNRGVALRSGYADNYINAAMAERIYSILYMAARYSDCKTLILGAFGCGVFMNMPEVVATIFKDIINTHFSGVFETIVFAILERGAGDKVSAFKKVFEV